MFYGTFLIVHSAAMTLALSLLVISELLLVPARSGPTKAALLASRIGGGLMGVGVIAGIGLVFVGGWSLLTPWLLVSFALIGVMMALEGKYVRPWEKQARGALQDVVSADEIRAFVRRRGALVGRLAIIALFGVITILMVTKPDMSLF